MNKTTKLIVIGCLAFFAATGSAQENLINDPYFQSPPLYGAANLGNGSQWVTTFQMPAVGNDDRVRIPSFGDSIMHCSMRYTANASRNCCSFSQVISSARAKHYRLGFWAKFATSGLSLTAEVRYANSDLSDLQGTLGAQLVCRSAVNDNSVGRWKFYIVDVDLSSVKNLMQLNSLRISFFPQCAGDSVVKSDLFADISVRRPFFCAFNDATSLSPYILDGDFEKWNLGTASSEQSLKYWEWNAATGCCVSRSSGLNDFDHALKADFAAASNGTFIASTNGGIRVPSRKCTLTFYARAIADGASILVNSSIIGNVGTVNVPKGCWTRQEVVLDYPASATAYPFDDALKFILGSNSANSIKIDGVTIAPLYDASNPRPVENVFRVTNPADSGDNTLRNVMAIANSGDSISIDIADKSPIKLITPIDMSNKGVIVEGNGNAIEAATPDAAQRLIYAVPTQNKTQYKFRDLTLRPGNTGNDGGSAIYIGNSKSVAENSFIFENVTFIGGSTTGNGGAVYIDVSKGNSSFYNCSFSSCTSSAMGGAVITRNPSVVSHCSFSACNAQKGAAYAVNGAAASVDYCIFKNCVSSGSSGGTLYNNNQTSDLVSVSRSAFIGNSSDNATQGCAGVVNAYANGSMSVVSCTFAQNSALMSSGVCFYNISRVSGGFCTVTNCTFVGNSKSPALLVDASGSYIRPKAAAVNNLFAHNYGGDFTVTGSAAGTIVGSNNLLSSFTCSTSDALTGTISANDADHSIFAGYTDTIPTIDGNNAFAINAKGAAKGAGISEYLVDGVNIVPATDQIGSSRPVPPSVGAYENTVSGISGVAAARMVAVYPNPATSQFTVAGAFSSVEVIDMTGSVVLRSSKSLVDVSELARGNYLVRVSTPAGLVTSKLILK